MDTNKNSYTIIYATILVIIVAAVLAFVSESLKSRQQKNIDVEKKLSILSSVGLAKESNTVPDKLTYIEKEYEKYIQNSFVVNYKGEQVEGNAFKIDLKSQYDLMKQIASASDDKKQGLLEQLSLPVFICNMPNGKTSTILSCYGAGLWGPIWGYISLQDDNSTIEGAVFAHKGETPGLGAEIATENFRNQFKDKKIFDNGTFTSINIVKGGATPGNIHEVDAISGGTITSTSLEKTIRMWFEYYKPFLQSSTSATQSNVEDKEIEIPLEDALNTENTNTENSK